jgi:hypothetical protein
MRARQSADKTLFVATAGLVTVRTAFGCEVGDQLSVRDSDSPAAQKPCQFAQIEGQLRREHRNYDPVLLKVQA